MHIGQIINHFKKSIRLYMIFTLVYYDIVHMSSEIIQIIIAPDKF
jgi:hypothetical protein